MKNYRTQILIVIIAALSIWIVLPNNPGIHIGSFSKDIKTSLGLDLVGGVQVLLEADVPATTNVTSDAMSTARTIVENRINALGVSESVVQRVGERRIVVEIPGIGDPAQAIATMKSTGLLEFVDMSAISQQEALTLEGKTIKTDYGQTSGTTPLTSTVTSTSPLPSTVTLTPTAPITPTATVTSTAPVTSTTDLTQRVWKTALTGADLSTATVSATSAGAYEVAITFTSDGGKKFADFTGTHVNKVLAIVLDKVVLSVPVIQNKITEGRGVITGNFTYESANTLAVQLRYGALPIPLKIIESSTVGPTLGQDSLRKSLIAGGIGLGLVILFMAFYYRLPGIIADVALMSYALFSFALFRLIPITLTLPGITGYVLSIGMAVDANILIFERLKEELRGGKTLRQAIDLGWGRAWPSIRDSNSSTLITCIILFWFGSTFGASIVKGFSLTLAIGVLVSLFTAIIVSRTLLHLVLDNIKSVEHPRWFGFEPEETRQNGMRRS